MVKVLLICLALASLPVPCLGIEISVGNDTLGIEDYTIKEFIDTEWQVLAEFPKPIFDILKDTSFVEHSPKNFESGRKKLWLKNGLELDMFYQAEWEHKIQNRDGWNIGD